MGISNWYLIYWCARKKERDGWRGNKEREIRLVYVFVNSVNWECTVISGKDQRKNERFDQQRSERANDAAHKSHCELGKLQRSRREVRGRGRDGIRHFIYIGTRLWVFLFASLCVCWRTQNEEEDGWCNQWWPRNKSRIKHNSHREGWGCEWSSVQN